MGEKINQWNIFINSLPQAFLYEYNLKQSYFSVKKNNSAKKKYQYINLLFDALRTISLTTFFIIYIKYILLIKTGLYL